MCGIFLKILFHGYLQPHPLTLLTILFQSICCCMVNHLKCSGIKQKPFYSTHILAKQGFGKCTARIPCLCCTVSGNSAGNAWRLGAGILRRVSRWGLAKTSAGTVGWNPYNLAFPCNLGFLITWCLGSEAKNLSQLGWSSTFSWHSLVRHIASIGQGSHKAVPRFKERKNGPHFMVGLSISPTVKRTCGMG